LPLLLIGELPLSGGPFFDKMPKAHKQAERIRLQQTAQAAPPQRIP
jgi:hypothetical protein